MKIEVNKICETKDATLSMLSIDGQHFCFVLEDGFRAVKQPGQSRIAGGVYNVIKRFVGKFYEEYKRRFKHEFSIQIEGVANFEDILAHIGNSVKDTRGCLLLGFVASLVNYDIVIEQSTPAYLAFYKLVDKAFKNNETVTLTINR